MVNKSKPIMMLKAVKKTVSLPMYCHKFQWVHVNYLGYLYGVWFSVNILEGVGTISLVLTSTILQLLKCNSMRMYIIIVLFS